MKLRIAGLLLLILLGACDGATPTPSTGRGFAYIWHISTTGDDRDSCDLPSDPCRTLEGVVSKAKRINASLAEEYPDLYTVNHTIHLAAGTYDETGPRDGYALANIDFNVTIVGEGQESSIIDAGGIFGGIFIHNTRFANLRDFTIRNVDGTAPDSCINLRDVEDVEIRNVTVTRCVRNGIFHSAPGLLTLINVTATDNIDDGFGTGTGLSSTSDVVVEGGEFSRNEGPGIASSGSLRMNFVRIRRNGRDGLQIYSGTAHLSEVEMIRNGEEGSFAAGLYISVGRIVVEHSTINNNQLGVRINGAGGSLQLIDTLVSDNALTGILVNEGELSMSGSTVSNNGIRYRNTGLAAGLRNTGRSIINNSIFSSNRNGAIYNEGSGHLTLVESSIIENDGGLPAFYNANGASAYIERSLIANNTRIGRIVTTDSAVENRGALTMINSTVSGNDGDGVHSSSNTNLSYVTVAFNSGYGFLTSNASDALPRLSNLLIASNRTDCYRPVSSSLGPPTLLRHNIDTDGSCAFPETISPATLMLSPLADNGGPTWTHALDPASLAVDAAIGLCPISDQRSYSRPPEPNCDVGAYEISDTVIALEAIEIDEIPDLFEIYTPAPSLEHLATALQNASCRRGADTAFEALNFLYEGQTALLIGRIAEGTWFFVELPDELGRCWIFAENLDLFGDVEGLPFFTPPELPEFDDGSGDEGGEDESGGGDSEGEGEGGEGQGDPQDPGDPEGPEDCDPQTEYWSNATNQCETLI